MAKYIAERVELYFVSHLTGGTSCRCILYPVVSGNTLSGIGTYTSQAFYWSLGPCTYIQTHLRPKGGDAFQVSVTPPPLISCPDPAGSCRGCNAEFSCHHCCKSNCCAVQWYSSGAVKEPTRRQQQVVLPTEQNALALVLPPAPTLSNMNACFGQISPAHA